MARVGDRLVGDRLIPIAETALNDLLDHVALTNAGTSEVAGGDAGSFLFVDGVSARSFAQLR